MARYFYCFYLLIVTTEVLTLKIDSEYGTSSKDCFERILIGWQLPRSVIYQEALKLNGCGCEDLCRKDHGCRSYDYGVDAKGNATCDLSNAPEKDIVDNKLAQHNSDYDVYVRRFKCEQAPPKPIQQNVNDLIDNPDDEKPYHNKPEKPINSKPHKPYPEVYNSGHNDKPNNVKPNKKPNYHHEDKPDVSYHYVSDHNLRPDESYHYGSDHNLRPDQSYHYASDHDLDIAYGHHTPPDYLYRPHRPYDHHSKPKPDKYDVFHFQNNIHKPKPVYSNVNLRPDPLYQDDIDEDSGYGVKPSHHKPIRPEYNNHYNKPIAHQPDYYQYPAYYNKPNSFRPGNYYETETSLQKPSKPSYYEDNQSYGGSNNVYVEFNEFPRPIQKPSNYKPCGAGSNPYRNCDDFFHKPNYNQVANHKPVPSNYENDHTYNSYAQNSWNDYNKPMNTYSNDANIQNYGYHGQYESTTSGYGSQSNWYNPSQNRPEYGNGNNSYQYSGHDYDKRPYYGASSEYYSKPSFNDKPNYTQNFGHNSKPNYDYFGKPESQDYYNKPNYPDNHYYNTKPSNNYYSKPNNYNGLDDNSNSHYAKPTLPQPGYNDNNYYAAYDKPDYKPKPDYNKPDHDHSSRPVYDTEGYKPTHGHQEISSSLIAISGPGYPERKPEKVPPFLVCFRRVFAGKRAVRSHVKRLITCERLEDCRLECAREGRFPCESFNYKHDPTFRGKGLCELMTKPIEAFDIKNDFVADINFDFYEIDRNSLEPHCSESKPLALHSGYFSKPNQIPNYEYDYKRPHSGYGGSGSDRRRYQGRRRYQEPYIPYQIGMPQPDTSWGQYGGSYGNYGSYYKDNRDYYSSVNYWRLPHDGRDPYVGVRHNAGREMPDFDYNSLAHSHNDRFDNDNSRYGNRNDIANSQSGNGCRSCKPAWHTGNGLDYAETNYYKPIPPSSSEYPSSRTNYPGDSTESNECTTLRKPGMAIGSAAIRRSIQAQNVLECESACFNEKDFTCVSYSYRYSTSHGTDNCFLSERPFGGVAMSSELGSDVYALPQPQCQAHTPWLQTECFWHVRSNSAVAGWGAKLQLFVTGLGGCEAECLRAQGFYCRGFSFRFNPPSPGEPVENCILTSFPPTSLTPESGLRPSSTHELYARGNYGRGCEAQLYDNDRADYNCFIQYDKAARLIGPAIKGRAHVADEDGCIAACTDAPFTCLSFSYTSSPSDGDNCLLSEIRLYDLQLGVDYEHSTNDWLFAYEIFNTHCLRKLRPPLVTQPGSDHVPVSGPPYLPEPPTGPTGPNKPSYIPETGPSGPQPPHPDYDNRPDYDPNIQYTPNTPDYRPQHPNGPPLPGYKPTYGVDSSEIPNHSGERPSYSGERPIYSGGRPSHSGERPSYSGERPSHGSSYGPYRPGLGPDTPSYKPVEKPGYPERDDGLVPWRHYTVSGYPCKTGSSCAQNRISGHWACEPEGGEIGSWDYCCAPTHRCGYSEGFNKPWCYVGPSSEQWRPCSDKYYPHHQHGTPHPAQGGKEPGFRPNRPWSQPDDHSHLVHRPSSPGYPEDVDDHKYYDGLYKDGPQAYYDPEGNPLPGYVKIPTTHPSRIHYEYRPGPPHSGDGWQPVTGDDLPPPVPGGLGPPRYWPVAYLHKGPPPNVTYYKYNETDHITSTTEKYQRVLPNLKTTKNDSQTQSPKGSRIPFNDVKQFVNQTVSTVTEKLKDVKDIIVNSTAIEKGINNSDAMAMEKKESSGIDLKLNDFSAESLEVLNIEDAKSGDKQPDQKTLEAEERQIEAIGRLLANQRAGKLVLDGMQRRLDDDRINVNKDLVDFDFGSRYPERKERKVYIQRISKEDIKAERERNNDKSLETSETAYVHLPRTLTTTDNIRKAIINGKTFYDATLREQRDLNNKNISNNNVKAQRSRGNSARQLDETRAPSLIPNSNLTVKPKNVRIRNVNPVRRVRRVYRRKYNPEEVRKRLLEREKNKQEIDV